MADEDIKSADNRDLWQRARGPREDQSSAADPLDLAAYLEGRLAASELEEVEGRLARSTADMELLLAARDVLEGVPEGPPLRALERAKALRASPPRVAAQGFWPAMGRWFALGRQSPLRSLALAGTAALYMAVCVMTFDLGRQGAVENLVVSQAEQVLDFGLTLDDVL